MAVLVKQDVDSTGSIITFQAADVAGETFVNTGQEVLHIRNGGIAAVTVTVVTSATVDGLDVDDREFIVGIGEHGAIGPFDGNIYGNAVVVSYDVITSVTVALVD